MAHYAFLDDNNIVTEVITGRNEDEVVDGISDWEEYYGNLRGQVCKRTSYNSWAGKRRDLTTDEVIDEPGFRKNFAGIGFTYSYELDAFIPVKHYDSWILDEATCQWEPPIPEPDDGKDYYWDEESGTWDTAP